MKSTPDRTRRFRSPLWAAAALLAAVLPVQAQNKPAASPDAAGPAKIAEIQGFQGRVAVKNSAGEVRTPNMIAKRVRGGSLYNADTVATQNGGSVEILFLDGTKITQPENAMIQIEEKKLAKPTEKGQTIGRRIKILAGKVVSAVQPSKDIVTEFETPAGVAAVRGTELEVGFDGRDIMTLLQKDGVTELSDGDELGNARVGKGTNLFIQSDGPGGKNPSWEVTAGKTTVLYEVPGVGRIECDMDSGDRITLDPDIGASVDTGEVEIRTPEGDAFSLSAGQTTDAGGGDGVRGGGGNLSALEQVERDNHANPMGGGPYSGMGGALDTGTYLDSLEIFNEGGQQDPGPGPPPTPCPCTHLYVLDENGTEQFQSMTLTAVGAARTELRLLRSIGSGDLRVRLAKDLPFESTRIDRAALVIVERDSGGRRSVRRVSPRSVLLNGVRIDFAALADADGRSLRLDSSWKADPASRWGVGRGDRLDLVFDELEPAGPGVRRAVLLETRGYHTIQLAPTGIR